MKKIKVDVESSDHNMLIEKYNLHLSENKSLASLLKTSKIEYSDLMSFSNFGITSNASVGHLVASEIRYAGYVAKQDKEIETLKASYNITIPEGLDYKNITGLSNEAIERLSKASPESIGQAANVPGISSTSLALLKIHLKKNKHI